MNKNTVGQPNYNVQVGWFTWMSFPLLTHPRQRHLYNDLVWFCNSYQYPAQLSAIGCHLHEFKQTQKSNTQDSILFHILIRCVPSSAYCGVCFIEHKVGPDWSMEKHIQSKRHLFNNSLLSFPWHEYDSITLLSVFKVVQSPAL